MNSAAALYIIAGVCAFAAITHLLAALRREFAPTNAWFAALSAVAVGYALSLVFTYHASTIPQYAAALKWNVASIFLLFMIFSWFIARLTGIVMNRWLVATTLLYAILLVWNAALPFGVSYDEITQLTSFKLPWGESIAEPVGHLAASFWLGSVLVISTLVVSVWWLAKAWRRTRERPLLFMLLAVAVFFVLGLEGFLVRAKVLNFVHMGPLGFLALIVAMSLSLSHLSRKALLESERRFRSLVEQSPFSIQVMSGDGRTLQVNDAWRRLWDGEVGEPGSTTDDIKPYVDHASRGSAVEIPPRKYPFRGTVPAAAGDRWIRTFIYPIRNATGKVLNLILMHEDVTEQHRADMAIRAVTEELRQTQHAVLQQERLRALGQMASGVAHDVNNAISPAAIYVETLLSNDHTLSKRAREYLAIIQQAIDAVAQSVARLREFYRPREPNERLDQLDVNQMITQVIELTRARWSDIPQQRGVVIRLRSELADDVPPIAGSEAELRDSLTNLVFNAVDAMPAGGTLMIQSRVRHARVCIEISDTGNGMDAETRRRCMEPFFTTKGERGTGLGLATVYGMAQRCGGEIEIESEPGRGTLVRLLFPGREVGTALPSRTGAVSQLGSGVRMLLIDDDSLQLESLREALEMSGCRVTCADGGQAGINEFLAALRGGDPYAVVITDLGMPHVDGRAVAGAIVRASPGTPVILLTGWGHAMLEQNDVPEGVSRVISKPPNVGNLRAAIAQVIDERRAARAN